MVSRSQEELFKKLIGENIRKVRKRHRLTQDSFSEKIGIEPANLSNIENGKSFPSALTVIQIQKNFKISSDEIFDIENFKSIQFIEKETIDSIQNLDENQKRLVWRIVKAIE